MDDLLGKDMMDVLSPPPAPSRTLPADTPHPYFTPSSPNQSSVYHFSGVLLAHDDLSMLSDSGSPSPPSSLEPYRPPSPQFDPSSHYQYYNDEYIRRQADEQAFYSPPLSEYDYHSERLASTQPWPPQRPRSAPASPELGGGGFSFPPSNHHVNAYASPTSPAHMAPELQRRRGGSLADTYDQHQHERGEHPYYSSPRSRTVSNNTQPPPRSSNQGRRSVARSSGAPKFVNFTSTDASILLSGVAPSGSSKRKREEEEERRRRLSGV